MTKQEFEALAIRSEKTISPYLYDTIERFYMSENDYHRAHGGIYETKQEFVKRVFGGKVNTPASVLKKIVAESQRENRWALAWQIESGRISKERVQEMDALIEQHYKALAEM